MSGIWGNNIKVSIFGESHGHGVGIVIDGLPGGIKLDMDYIKYEMDRRKPGKSKLTTSRKEADEVKILSGYFNGKTTGTPLCAFIENTNTRSRDYSKTKDLMRPGHADYTGYMKYNQSNDYRGGGHFSGRLTAPLVFAGSIAKQILEKNNILIGSHISSIYTQVDETFDYVNCNEELVKNLRLEEFPLIDKSKADSMKDIILRAKEEGNSVGGIVETIILNVETGIGSPFFSSIESRISSMMFSIPAIKGIEFGEGFNMAKMKGNESNDEYCIKDGEIRTYTNNNGGILGGISNGMPIVFKCAIKPTPSISMEQRTINIESKEETSLSIEGRHDPCIVPRAIPVIEAGVALTLLDMIIEKKGLEWIN
ncbi:chorismate synthase [Anaeromicrobium sediminis]|uniref:Chorismate synthase n=1 Tax=Anaeromicrobium sediminis TaxID=1478221 RepID=A0A267MLQ3_9FIRM|nr:chorismate synthase [Anaeromicrobium sediminis]PAB59838.1 chorismate synthase [Anaeromicrobium sediminis]